MPIKIKLQGFEELFRQIEEAGGSIDSATNSALQQSAQIMQSELKSQMQSAGISSSLINRMPSPEVSVQGNRYKAKVGYKSTGYNPKNPSDYHEAIFLNYGTPSRTKHGKVKARGFIQKAKKSATPKIKKVQKQVLEKVLARLRR